ncbi:MAG: ATP-binding protein [Nanoarchaeota archaeon]|nr:ATP-binding protein [Nanoarchaeota archaeon]
MGPRQSGKTTALKLLIKHLLEKEAEPKMIFYFNCEELGTFNEIIELLNAYKSYKEAGRIKSSIIMLDEVTAPSEWYRGIKSVIDKGKLKDDVLIITGSSSINIKKHTESFPGRRGNGRDFTLMPLSFRNFLEIMSPKLHSRISASRNMHEICKKAAEYSVFTSELNAELKKYMICGGFPLAVGTTAEQKDEAKKIYLSWIKNAVLKAERSDIIARQIAKSLIEKMPGPVSWEGISKEIEIKSPKTVSAYIELFNSIYCTITLYSADISGKQIKFGKNKKIHLTDPLLLEIFEDWCMLNAKSKETLLAEQIAASHIWRLLGEAYFWKNRIEVDIIASQGKEPLGIEVKWAEKIGEKEAGFICSSAKKSLPRLKSFMLLTKNNCFPRLNAVPLGAFLAAMDI